MDLRSEIELQTTRSGGKGGQNVNKVETAVIAYFNVPASAILNEEQKARVLLRLETRINKGGQLVVRAQTFRTQLENREEAIRRVEELVEDALKKKKSRIASRPSRAARERRLDSKKRASERKSSRRFRPDL